MLKIFIPDEVKQCVIDTIDSGDIEKERWDFSVEELAYLGENHPGEYFLLYNERLWEIYKDEVLD